MRILSYPEIVFAVLATLRGVRLLDVDRIERAVREWAPLVEFDAEEMFFPGDVEEFLGHVRAVTSDGTPVGWEDELPVGKSSEGVHLSTIVDLNQLRSGNSFLNGHNPCRHNNPTYVVVSQCSSHQEQFKYCPSKNRAFVASYWFFFPFNEGKSLCKFVIPLPNVFGKCIVGKTMTVGDHVGDFEHIAISFDENYEPLEIYLAVHNAGVYYEYHKRAHVFRYTGQNPSGELQKMSYPKFLKLYRKRPYIYSARGSHGMWAERGKHQFHRLPNLYDTTGHGAKWKTWKNLVIFHAGYSALPKWAKFYGKWGNPKNNCYFFGICELSDAPEGFAHRKLDFQC